MLKSHSGLCLAFSQWTVTTWERRVAKVNCHLFVVLDWLWLSFFQTNYCHLVNSDDWLSYSSSTADMCNSLATSVQCLAFSKPECSTSCLLKWLSFQIVMSKMKKSNLSEVKGVSTDCSCYKDAVSVTSLTGLWMWVGQRGGSLLWQARVTTTTDCERLRGQSVKTLRLGKPWSSDIELTADSKSSPICNHIKSSILNMCDHPTALH